MVMFLPMIGSAAATSIRMAARITNRKEALVVGTIDREKLLIIKIM